MLCIERVFEDRCVHFLLLDPDLLLYVRMSLFPQKLMSGLKKQHAIWAILAGLKSCCPWLRPFHLPLLMPCKVCQCLLGTEIDFSFTTALGKTLYGLWPPRITFSYITRLGESGSDEGAQLEHVRTSKWTWNRLWPLML